ncbi:phosphoribosyltransferase-like protein [Blautia obeum]|jgi:hypothetical protein|uniref:PRTase-CE domain-containing protein n=1 Tax=Blautia obeum TaxID=40520 RepID=A0A174LYI2_9FIRM|nr:hypothetical protein [Blautia obeum]RHE11342.1 hypothetical protein DW767_11850 [Blautia obeum]RHM31619.1 hypothetical protein DWZ74_01500 [Blautia obeum]CUP26755.1 Uncharacterised protein [Blautia obeum]
MGNGRKHPKYENITASWGGMRVREEFAERIDAWLKAFPTCEHSFLLELLSEFYYYSEEQIAKKVVELYNLFEKEFTGDINEVVFTKIIKEQGIAFSDILFTTFWLKNNISNAENNILGLLEAGQIPKELVIVDDYSGTGKSFIKTVNKMLQTNGEVKNSQVYFLTLHITERALKMIREYEKELGIPIKVFYLDCTEEVFKTDYIYNKIEAEYKKRDYIKICERQEVKENYILGYEDVESLITFYYNTPNNTLGLFWQNLGEFVALFPRRERKRTSLSRMQREAQNRKRRDQEVVIYGIPETKLKIMLLYCLGQEKGISVEDFKQKFGLNSDQAYNALKTMLDEGYVYNRNGCFFPDVKLRSRIFMSRIKKGQERFKEKKEEIKEFSKQTKYIPQKF